MRFRILFAAALFASLLAASAGRWRAAGNLNIYFIDVEGGQSTLILTPSGESLLVDAGYGDPPGRDARRILAAAQDAGIDRIDVLLLTHFHADHIGGVPELVKRMAVGTIVDHDTITGSDAAVVKPFNLYLAARKKAKQHLVAKVGDRLPLRDVEATIVSSAGSTLTRPLGSAGDRNASCRPTAQPPNEAIENPRSTGFLLRFGAFRFLDLGDLTGKPLYALFCPSDLVGRVDVYLVPHHGNDDVSDPAPYAVLKPRVAIVNNGETKGGGPELLAALHKMPGIDVWQLHRSGNAGAENAADDRVANVDSKSAHWIKVTAREDGSFAVTNGRTGRSKDY